MTRNTMQVQSKINNQKLRWICIPLFVIFFSMPAVAGDTPLLGTYCPSQNTRLSIAEELAASLDLSMHSRAAQINKDSMLAIRDLASVRTTLFLASSHGAAARTALIIDAIIQSKADEDYAQMLATWFPLLRRSLQTLPSDATVKSAGDLIDQAEEFMQGESEGDPMDVLSQARHMLTCDRLDIPLQKAMKVQSNLIKQLDKKTNSKAYDALLNALHNALNYTLESSGGDIE